MNTLTRPKIWALRLLAVSPIVWFILFFLFHFTVLLPRANHAEKILQIELSYINSPSHVQLQESGASHKTNQANAYNRYSTLLSHDEIFDYYDDELARHGWRYLGQHNITLEAVGRNYCKGNYTASLDYYGFGYTWKYELWLSAGQTSDCEMLKGGGFAFIPFSDLWFLLACSVSWSIYAVIIGWASWRMTQKEFMQFMGNIVKGSTGVWRSRINSAFILLISLIGILLSVYKIVMYLINE